MDLIANITLLAATSDTGFFAGWTPETIAHWTGVVLKVILGLGAVIFVHELGHFLVAKACGVKCDKFYVGFDVPLGRLFNWLIGRPGEMKLLGVPIPRTIGPRVQWGETEYGIGILPLGGYVKMLGQDDDPAHVAEQMQKSQVDAANANGVEVIGPNGEKYFVDRRSYVAKSVPQRMAIISAGVIMNVIFAVIFAVIAYGMGVPYMPSIVSEAMPGSPAYEAGIEPGDQFVRIGNRDNPTFNQLRGGVTLGDPEGIPTLVRRASTGEVESILLKPEQGTGLATIGIISPRTLTLADFPAATIDDSPAAEAKLISPAATDLKSGEAKLESGDEIVRVGDVGVENYRELAAQLAVQPDKALSITVRRPPKQVEGEANQPASSANKTEDQLLTFEVPARPLRGVGLMMKMEAVASVQADSPAAAAGLEAGDVITLVDGQAMASDENDFTSLEATTLPEYFRKAAGEDRAVELTVVRGKSADRAGETKTIRIAPREPITFHSQLAPHGPMPVPSAGFAYGITNEVAGVLPNGPAAKSGIRPGDKLTSAKLILPKQDASADEIEPVTIGTGKKEVALPALLTDMQNAPPDSAVELSFERRKSNNVQQARIALAPIEGAFIAERGFVFEPIERIRKADTFAEQVRFGWDETIESLTMVYRFLQKIGTQVPITALGGPVTIAKAAGYSASAGIPTFLIFLTMLSANLAVVNFLPIPLLDGGHMVFLAYEGVRGRPANEKFVGAMHMAGFVFIVSLMLFVLGLDFGLIDRNL